MKKRLAFAICLLLALAAVSVAQEATATPSPAPKPRPAMSKAQIQNQLIATEKKLWEAWKNKDVKPFKAHLSPNSVMISENGLESKDSILKFIEGHDCVVKSYELSDFKVTWVDSDAALLTYKATQDATCGGTAAPAAVWAASLYVRRGGKWYAATHQETVAKSSP
jgi:hypothetical protein